MTNYEGFKSEQELPLPRVRVDPQSGTMTAVIDDMACPNGLALLTG